MLFSAIRLRLFAQHMLRACVGCALLPLLCAAPSASASQKNSAETRTARAFADARRQSPLALHAFLEGMPKGADLHMHLSGAVYAETMLDEAASDDICVDAKTLSFDRKAAPGHCKPGEVSGPAELERDNHLRDELIDSFSMRGFVPSEGVTGHDHFFATFAHFGGLGKEHTGDWLDAIATRAARQNEQYLEIMDTPRRWPKN
jgi:adenosine deaminase